VTRSRPLRAAYGYEGKYVNWARWVLLNVDLTVLVAHSLAIFTVLMFVVTAVIPERSHRPDP
jgi:hypothetical protein